MRYSDDVLDVAVIGGGQAGLAMAWHLRRHRLRFAVLDAAGEVGAAWRSRWDSLRLFTSARYDGLPGLPFPGAGDRYPTKDEVADYLRGYAAAFDLPVRLDTPGRPADPLRGRLRARHHPLPPRPLLDRRPRRADRGPSRARARRQSGAEPAPGSATSFATTWRWCWRWWSA
ncbi:MAG: FAD-dependent oxidoreductase [Pseudonocardia sp.]|nr:FAD-dependent oxidoreductase [Pseudonocardia sp.]